MEHGIIATVRTPVAGLCALALLSGCAPGASGVTIVRPAHPIFVSCPGSQRRYDVRVVLGLDEREARSVLARRGCELRVVEEDGQSRPRTGGESRSRVDVEVTSGRIVRIAHIG